MSHVATPEWFAVMVKPNFEHCVSELLEFKGYEHLLPLVQKRRKWSDRWKVVSFPLFSRYVFCRFRFDQRVPILNTPGVVKIVTLGARPSPIPDHEIDALRSVTATAVEVNECSYVASGQRVRINSGPLVGMEGIFIEAKAKCRVVISVHLLQRSAYVEIDRDCVDPIAEIASSMEKPGSLVLSY